MTAADVRRGRRPLLAGRLANPDQRPPISGIAGARPRRHLRPKLHHGAMMGNSDFCQTVAGMPKGAEHAGDRSDSVLEQVLTKAADLEAHLIIGAEAALTRTPVDVRPFDRRAATLALRGAGPDAGVEPVVGVVGFFRRLRPRRRPET